LHNVIRAIKWNRVRWGVEVHVAHVVERREIYTGFLWGNLRKINHLEEARLRW
jgi:hypothetical protein